MKILLPFFVVTSRASYPDDYKKFSAMEDLTFNGNKYYLCEYSGSLSLETGPDTYAEYEAYIASLPPVTGIRNISLRAFYERLGAAARIALNSSAEDDVKDVVAGLGYSAYVNLDSPIFSRDVSVLVAKAIITQTEADSLYLDGATYEAYNGVL